MFLFKKPHARDRSTEKVVKVFTTEMKVTGPAGQQKMNCCGPNWPDSLKNARGPAGT